MHKWFVVALVVGVAGCGSGSNPNTPPPVPSTTIAAQPSPTPTPQPTPTPTPAALTCDFEPGPVTRMAISPREQRTDGAQVSIRVRALPGFDEVWCLDKDKSHRIDFNANQRNASGRECCYEGDATWKLDDPRELVVGQSARHDDGMIYRYSVEPRGVATSFSVQAELDGVKSFPWQSGSGYTQGPLQVVTMSASQITRECLCIYEGNGIYEGAGCRK
jgi:hypothetical protein